MLLQPDDLQKLIEKLNQTLATFLDIFSTKHIEEWGKPVKDKDLLQRAFALAEGLRKLFDELTISNRLNGEVNAKITHLRQVLLGIDESDSDKSLAKLARLVLRAQDTGYRADFYQAILMAEKLAKVFREIIEILEKESARLLAVAKEARKLTVQIEDRK